VFASTSLLSQAFTQFAWPNFGIQAQSSRYWCPFEAAVPAGCGAAGVMLADHVKSVDWKVRRAERLGHCTTEALGELRARLAPLLGC
jgi:mRNA-degrading endonuclease toxin of MazEF toxin-antitoxin module